MTYVNSSRNTQSICCFVEKIMGEHYSVLTDALKGKKKEY